MLQVERTEAGKILYDQPSNNLLRFLAKNYNLTNYIVQNSNFLVFSQFFEVS